MLVVQQQQQQQQPLSVVCKTIHIQWVSMEQRVIMRICFRRLDSSCRHCRLRNVELEHSARWMTAEYVRASESNGFLQDGTAAASSPLHHDSGLTLEVQENGVDAGMPAVVTESFDFLLQVIAWWNHASIWQHVL